MVSEFLTKFPAQEQNFKLLLDLWLWVQTKLLFEFIPLTFRHVGKILKVLWKFLSIYLVFGTILEATLAIFYAIG